MDDNMKWTLAVAAVVVIVVGAFLLSGGVDAQWAKDAFTVEGK